MASWAPGPPNHPAKLTALPLRDRAPDPRVKISRSQPKNPPSKQTSTAIDPKFPNFHILLVEDNVLNQRVLSKQLIKAGCTVHIANHGGEAMRFLSGTKLWTAPNSKDNADTDINVVLMDWEMPVMDGVTSSRRIRELEQEGKLRGRVPIIGTTANARQAQIRIALDAGMVSGPSLWMGRIWECLHERVGRRGHETLYGAGTDGSNQSASASFELNVCLSVDLAPWTKYEELRIFQNSARSCSELSSSRLGRNSF